MFSTSYVDFMRSEKDGTSIYRPHGSANYLFLYFPVPMNLTGTVLKPNCCVLFSPSDYQHFYGTPVFCNSFVHFTSDSNEMNDFSIPYGKVFYPPDFSRYNKLIRLIKEETLCSSLHTEKMIHSYISQIVTITERYFSDQDMNSVKKQFEAIRYEMLENYQNNYSSTELSKKLCMSKSRFYEYYRQFFNNSPKQELLRKRMEIANILLSNKNKTVSDISSEVGFENTEHFIRYYKKLYGKTPRNFSDKTSIIVE